MLDKDLSHLVKGTNVTDQGEVAHNSSGVIIKFEGRKENSKIESFRQRHNWYYHFLEIGERLL